MDAGTLHKAISEVCPVESTRVENPTDRATWSFVPGTGATQPQIDAGNNVIATIPIETVPPPDAREFIARFTDAEYLLLKQKHRAELDTNAAGGLKIWDIVIGCNLLDLNSKDAKDLKADLIADGVLTQARADVIFGAPTTRARRMF